MREECPLCANSGLMHCSKLPLYSITSSARASNIGGTSSPKRFSSLEIDDQLELDRTVDRKVAWLIALENTADVDAIAAVGIGKDISVAHQATRRRGLSTCIHCRDRVLPGQCDDLFAPADEEWTGRDN